MPHSIPNQPALKVCSKCGESKPLSEYSVNRKAKDNLHPYCKSCARVYGKEWREQNRARRLEYMREWHAQNLQHENQYARERYQNDEEHRQRVLDWQRVERERNPERVRERERSRVRDFGNDFTRAHTAVNRAVRRGLLPPAWSMVCEVCDEAQAAHYHHHNGYDRDHWLDVIPACLDCHGKEHRKP